MILAASGPVVATVGISVGTLLLGFLLGLLLGRRGRRLKLDWHLALETDEGHHRVGNDDPEGS